MIQLFCKKNKKGSECMQVSASNLYYIVGVSVLFGIFMSALLLSGILTDIYSLSLAFFQNAHLQL